MGLWKLVWHTRTTLKHLHLWYSFCRGTVKKLAFFKCHWLVKHNLAEPPSCNDESLSSTKFQMDCSPGIGETHWLGFETNIWSLEPFESKSKSISILDSCMSQYRNQYQYFSSSWPEIKTNTDTYHTWYQLRINVTRNTIFYFYGVLISHRGCNHSIFS